MIQDSDCMIKYSMLRQVHNLHHAMNHNSQMTLNHVMHT